jgi:predicted HD phosphohydrolase
VVYTRMDQMTAEDYAQERPFPPARMMDYVIGQLERLRGEADGVAEVDRYDHSLQTATRCLRDGSDSETVVCALLHDMGYTLAPNNHAEVAASVLRPFVSEQNWWVVKHHDIFQSYYYLQHIGQDRKLRDEYRGHPYYGACVRFCGRWDQRSFDAAYQTEQLNTFLPLVKEVLGRTPADLIAIRD